MAINFTNIVGQLAGLGFYSFVLPWLLFFAVILGVLNFSKPFGPGGTRINAIIAAAVAFFITAFTPAGTTLAAYFTTIFGVGAMTLAVLLLIVILGGVLGYKPDDITGAGGTWAKPLVGLVIIALAVLAFGAATGTGINIPGLDSETWTVIFILVFVLLAIWYAEGSAAGGDNEQKEEKTAPGGRK